MSNNKILGRIKVGDVITSELLNSITLAINDNTKAVASPVQADPYEDSNTESVGNEIFDSTSGTETTITITDDNGDQHDVERVDSVVFTEQTSGRTLTLNLTYPL